MAALSFRRQIIHHKPCISNKLVGIRMVQLLFKWPYYYANLTSQDDHNDHSITIFYDNWEKMTIDLITLGVAC